MKTLWFFVILAAVNGEVTQCNDVKKWGEAEGDTPEVRIDPTIFIDILLFSVRKHAGNVATIKVAIK